jgi:transposase
LKKERRHWSAEEKVKLLRRHLIEKVPVSRICEEARLVPSLFHRWQEQLFLNGALALEGKRAQHRNMPTSISLHRLLRCLLAILFAAATTTYTVLWVQAVRQAPRQPGFVSYAYSAATHSMLVGAVVPGSPAEKAGLQTGDRIVAIDGNPVMTFVLSITPLLSVRRTSSISRLNGQAHPVDGGH